ncbi:hypothetical protein [Rhizorhabdus sp.]|jgi:hypothetical protein|uniref:hypothetical protein n=1 Tax=Rhizorhabdus sp. TaxID=1968843 RepID=UPI00198870EF|nr:hypothetical protein [Rhizorhabdus sp.]MBD3761470.1 hypothetical protein [Rhizorhabdus sp.]
MAEPSIYIRRADQGGFAVTVEPSQGEAVEHQAQCHKAAYGFASGLRMTHRWPIIDQTKGDAE